jgi:hypothetical protein
MSKKKRDPPPSFATSGDWHKHYIVLFDDLLNSPAYISLSSPAKEAYTILLQEYKGPYTGPNVICPYSTFQSKGMRAATLSRALLELETFGFISYESGGLGHRPSKYHFKDEWKKIKTEGDLKEVQGRFKQELDKKKAAQAYKKAVS